MFDIWNGYEFFFVKIALVAIHEDKAKNPWGGDIVTVGAEKNPFSWGMVQH